MSGEWAMRNSGSLVVEDSSGSRNNGLLIGESSFRSDEQMGDSIEITGRTGYLSVPHSIGLEPDRGGVETWIKPADLLRDVDVFNKLTYWTLRSGLDGGKAVYGVHLFQDGSLGGYILNDALPGGHMMTWVWGPRKLITAGQWHHLVLQWDGRQLTLYVNGKHVSRRAYTEVPGVGLSYSRESDFTLGRATRWFGNDDHQFIGQFGKTRVFQGSMTDTEIQLRATLPARLALP